MVGLVLAHFIWLAAIGKRSRALLVWAHTDRENMEKIISTEWRIEQLDLLL